MANIMSVDISSLPGLSPRTVTVSVFMQQDCPEIPTWMTGQLWPRGQGA